MTSSLVSASMIRVLPAKGKVLGSAGSEGLSLRMAPICVRECPLETDQKDVRGQHTTKLELVHGCLEVGKVSTVAQRVSR